MRFQRLALAFLVAVLLPAQGMAQRYTYVNYAPDVRYTLNDVDSRIGVDTSAMVYGYGHMIEPIRPCDSDLSRCITIDFMGFYRVPPRTPLGSVFRSGEFEFKVTANRKLSIVGRTLQAAQVEVRFKGALSNSYLFNQERGVVGIFVNNENTPDIPQSFFVLEGEKGMLSKGR